MRKRGGAGKKQQPDAIDEVEELLKLTQDDLLLKLSVNSHIKSKSKSKSKFDLVPESSHSNSICPDLDSRFQALRSKPNPKSKTTSGDDDVDVDVDDLFARFAALKAPNSTPASISASEDMKIVKDVSSSIVDVKDEDEEDEVQNIINWAIDAARLDPSPASDIDDEDDDSYDDDDSDEDEDTPTVARKKKGSKKKSRKYPIERLFEATSVVGKQSINETRRLFHEDSSSEMSVQKHIFYIELMQVSFS